jgi:hypothetical protein
MSFFNSFVVLRSGLSQEPPTSELRMPALSTLWLTQAYTQHFLTFRPIPRPEESYRLWCVFECHQMKSQKPSTPTVNKQVEEGRTAKRNFVPFLYSFVPLSSSPFLPSGIGLSPIGPLPTTPYLTNMYTVELSIMFFIPFACVWQFRAVLHHPHISKQCFTCTRFSTAMLQHKLNLTSCTVHTDYFYQLFLDYARSLKVRWCGRRRRWIQCNPHRPHTGLSDCASTRNSPQPDKGEICWNTQSAATEGRYVVQSRRVFRKFHCFHCSTGA